MINRRKLGLILVILAIAQIIIFSIVITQAREAILDKVISDEGGICSHIGDECPHEQVTFLDNITIVNYVIMAILLITGMLLIFSNRTKKVKYDLPKNLDEEEKKIVDIIKESDGSIFQSDLVSKTDYTKVKITRILDKLEGKKVIERKRRGMTNIVILRK